MQNYLPIFFGILLILIGLGAVARRLIRNSHDRTDAEVTSAESVRAYRKMYPSITDHWGTNPVDALVQLGVEDDENAQAWREHTNAPVTDEPLSQHVPNIGGFGNPTYRGPDYIPKSAVSDLHGKLSFFDIEEPSADFRSFLMAGTEYPGDLAWDYKLGHVAPDGTIWINPEQRATAGVCQIPLSEQVKSARFGWEFAGPAALPGFALVQRK